MNKKYLDLRNRAINNICNETGLSIEIISKIIDLYEKMVRGISIK